jgi:hypothetical protein
MAIRRRRTRFLVTSDRLTPYERDSQLYEFDPNDCTQVSQASRFDLILTGFRVPIFGLLSGLEGFSLVSRAVGHEVELISLVPLFLFLSLLALVKRKENITKAIHLLSQRSILEVPVSATVFFGGVLGLVSGFFYMLIAIIR